MNINMTETEYKALQYVAVSPEDWVQNVVENRARKAIDEIVKIYTERALDEGVQIPTTRDSIVADAFFRGWVKTAQEKIDEPINNLL